VRISFFATAPPAGAEVELYRALRDDVEFRYVALGPVPGAADGGEYEVVHEDGRDAVDGGVTLVDTFAVAAGDDDAFLAAWRERHAGLVRCRGYLGARLYRADDARRRFVEIARWSSPLMVARATGSPASTPPLYSRVPSES
jgi:hypothetical protein